MASGSSGVGMRKHRQIVWRGGCKTKNRSLLRDAQRDANRSEAAQRASDERKRQTQGWVDTIRNLWKR